MGWNDDAPDTIGLQWAPTTEGTVLLDSPTSVVPIKLTSTGAETVDQLIIPYQFANPGASGYDRQWVDLYALGAAAAPGLGAITETKCYPNEDKARSGTTRNDFSTTTNLYQQVDDADDSVDPTADYVVNASYGSSGSYFAVQFDTSGVADTRRIVYVRFEVRAKGFDWSWQPPKIYLDVYNNSTLVGRIPGSTISPPQDYVFRTYSLGPYYFDWYNEGTWLQPEIANYDVNTSRNIRVVMDYACAVTRLTMIVGTVAENRAAVGVSAKTSVAPTGVQSNIPILLKSPLNIDNWSKGASGDFLVVRRRLEDPFSTATTLTTQVLTIDSGSACPQAEAAVYAGASMVDQSGVLSSYGTVGTKVTGLFIGTSGGAQSVDSQPYFDIDVKPCSASSTLKQGINGASAQSYGLVQAVVAVPSTAPDADMTIKVRKVSDDSQVGGTATLAVADLASSTVATSLGTATFGGVSYTLYRVTVSLATPGTLAGSTDYYLEFTSAATNPWYVAWLDASASHALTGNITYGGSTDVATVAGVADNEADFMATLSTVPVAPSSVAAAVATVDFDDNGGALCDAGSLQYAQVSWVSGGAMGATFAYWEVQRSYDSGATWEAAATIATESTVTWSNKEVERGVPVKYRVRAVRTDGALSDWTTQADTVTVAAADGVLAFVSDADASVLGGYVLLGSQRKYSFRDRTVYADVHGRDFPLAFKDLNRRGFTWEFRVLIYVRDDETPNGTPAGGKGVRAFDGIRAIATADVPYLAVLTPDGEVLCGSIDVPEGPRAEPGHYYEALVQFQQTQAAPTAVSL